MIDHGINPDSYNLHLLERCRQANAANAAKVDGFRRLEETLQKLINTNAASSSTTTTTTTTNSAATTVATKTEPP
jgi:hypothetical protein